MTKAVPVAILLTLAVVLGVILGVLYLRGQRKLVLIGLHFLMGGAALETMALLQHSLPDSLLVKGGAYGRLALMLMAATLLSGLAAALWARGSRRASTIMLASHATLGATSFVLFMTWLSRF